MYRPFLTVGLLGALSITGCSRLTASQEVAQRQALAHPCWGYGGYPVFIVEERHVLTFRDPPERRYRDRTPVDRGHRYAQPAAFREARSADRDRGSRYGDSRNNDPKTRQRTRD